MMKNLSSWQHQKGIEFVGKREYPHLSMFPNSYLPGLTEKVRDGILTLVEKGAHRESSLKELDCLRLIGE